MRPDQIEALKRTGVDIVPTMERFMGNEALYLKCLGKFLADPNYDCLMKALKESDADAAFNASHTLKGVASNLGFDKLFIAVKDLVEVFRAGSLDYDPKALEHLKNVYKDTTEIVKSVIS